MNLERLLLETSKIGDSTTVKRILNNGVDPNYKNGIALKLASFNGHLDVVKDLIQYGADVNIDFNAPIRLASEAGNLSIVQLLISNGALFDQDALNWAIRNGHTKIVEYLLNIANKNRTITYPVTKIVEQEDNYHGTIVKDPYRWLEDLNSEDTKVWINEQNRITEEYLSQISFREKIKNKLKHLSDYPKYKNPFKKNNYIYSYRNTGLQNHDVLWRETMNGISEIFIDPNTMSLDGSISMITIKFSKFKYAVYSTSLKGSDWLEARIIDVNTKEILKDKLKYLKFTNFSWKGDEGFYYSRYPDFNGDKMKMLQNHKVYYHRVGTLQEDDVLIYEDPNPLSRVNAILSQDENFLILSKYLGGVTDRKIYVKDMRYSYSNFILISGDTMETFIFIDTHDNDKLWFLTNKNASNYKIIAIDINYPDEKYWITVVPERKDLLNNVLVAGGKMILHYLKDVSSRLYQIDYEGNFEKEIVLPGLGTVITWSGEKDETNIYYTFESFSYPPTVFTYDTFTGNIFPVHHSDVKIDVNNYETKQIFYSSKDGTKIPMFITHKKGLKLDGKNPTLMYAYGGFAVSKPPVFNIDSYFFMEQGGIYAHVNIRGGEEYGKKWHVDGILDKKQNGIDDFIFAAEYLIQMKYTNSEKLAAKGGSNGGLLIGAVITQRPELFKVAIILKGVLDMLRYQKFTGGKLFYTEYGLSENVTDFEYLYKYSPLHNIISGIIYPATLLIVEDNDERVVPLHTYKFGATLQSKNGGENPILIRIDSKSGHGIGKSTNNMIDEATNVMSFIMYNLDMNFKE